jgi:hypothetical protein
MNGTASIRNFVKIDIVVHSLVELRAIYRRMTYMALKYWKSGFFFLKREYARNM